jgi:spore coat protein U-like protein
VPLPENMGCTSAVKLRFTPGTAVHLNVHQFIADKDNQEPFSRSGQLQFMKIASTVVALAVLASCLVSACAATATSSFAVTVTVVNSCRASASAMTFGSYADAVANATSSVSVTCSSATPYNVGLSARLANGATVPAQVTTGSSPAVLGYALLPGSAHTVNSNKTETTDPLAATSNGFSQPLPVHGRNGWAQYVVPGSDMLIVTVTY